MNGLVLAALADWIARLPAINAALNGTAAVLLALGYVLIRRRREAAHRRVMLTAFAMSVLFLACYLVYHYHVGSVRFQGPPGVRRFYLGMLLSHVVLAAAVPFLALATIYLGLNDRRAAHRRLARWTLPIWLYVSLTGVAIYVMLYHLYPAGSGETIIPQAAADAPPAPPFSPTAELRR